jgi:predicted enzyme related to lactoylglutathione lyase
MTYVKKVGMIILMQHDLAKAVDFYQKLGLKLKFHLKDRWAEFEINTVKIGLCPTDEKEGLIRTGIVLEVEDLKKTLEETKGWIEYFGEIQEAVHGMMISFKDPSGNVLDLYQPTPEKIQEMIKKTGQDQDDGCCGSEEKCC